MLWQGVRAGESSQKKRKMKKAENRTAQRERQEKPENGHRESERRNPILIPLNLWSQRIRIQSHLQIAAESAS